MSDWKNNLESGEREYFGTEEYNSGYNRFALFLQRFKKLDSGDVFHKIGLSQENKGAKGWSWGKAFMFKPDQISEVQEKITRLINSIDQDTVIKQTAPKVEKPGDDF